MALVRGPFDLKWGTNTLVDVSDIKLDYSQDSKDYTTVDNRKYTIEGGITAAITLEFLGSDVAALAAVLPQYHVLNGGHLSSGETVTGTEGAIDIVAAQGCTFDPVYHDLDVIACGTNSQVFRLKNARTTIDSMAFQDNSVRTLAIKFVGEPDAGIGVIQFFRENNVTAVS